MRLTSARRPAAVAALSLLVTSAAAVPEVHHAPPTPVRVERASPGGVVGGGLRVATTEWSHGDPSDEEQLFLELMNRARMDPQAEADRILVDYGDADVQGAVDFFLNQRPGVEYTRQENHDAFDALAPLPPYALNSLISEAAHKHSVVMRIEDLQTHQATGEPRLGDRLTNEGYVWTLAGESIFAFTKSMVHAHAGFAVDWGQGLDGNTGRPTTGHRDSLMSTAFVECGIGLIDDPDTQNQVGPLLITIDFAVPADTTTRFVTGVVYDDTDGDGFYDPGEGIPGVRVETDSSDFYAITSASGGYSVPVPANAGDVVVLAGGQPGTPGEVVGTQQVQVRLEGANVKVDFGPLPEPALPTFSLLQGGRQVAIADGATVTDVVAVGQLSPDDATVGDIEVRMQLDHDDRSEVRLTLISPSGTEVALFDGAPGGRDLRGFFDAGLRPAEALSAFVGEPYQGSWTLRVEEAAGGTDGGVLEAWDLQIRPGWVRPLHAPAAPLVVKTLKAKDSKKAGKDKIVLKLDLDPGGGLLNVEELGGLRLLDAATGDEVLSVPLPDPFGDAPETGPLVKAKYDLNRRLSSRSAVVLKVSRLDLAGPLPAVTRVELALGGAILAEDVQVASGKFTGGAGRRFVVDALKSKTKEAARSTVVKGRFGTGAALGAVEGPVELIVGDARYSFDAEALSAKGSKLVYKSGVGLRKLVVDTAKGTFSAKVEGAHELLVDGATPIVLRLGDAFYGATRVRPYDKGTKTLY